MVRSKWQTSGLALGLALLMGIAGSAADPAHSPKGMVAAVQPLAVRAGIDALHSGGNAVDAAVATALTLGVVDGHNSGLGGGCFLLIRRPNGSFLAIDGRETAPAAAHRDMYLRDGKADSELSTTGPLAVATPGALAAYDRAIREVGRKKLAELLLPAAELAEQGFPIDRIYADKLQGQAMVLARFEGSRRALLQPDGKPYRAGDLLRQPDLAQTYRAIATQGPNWFYRDTFARRVAAWMKQHGGILTEQDFASYAVQVREPLQTSYRGLQLVGFPPPSSGGVHVAEILNILDQFDLPTIFRQDPTQFVHIVSEAMKLAFADRAYWLGDPEFARVPRGLADRSYAAELARRINPRQVTSVERHGMPPKAENDFFPGHTTHIAAADAEGWWVAITATVNTTFGSKVIVPGTGVVLNNQMDDFSIQPGVPNAFGLVGAEANAVGPGKRPLSSMSPTIVLRNDQPIMTVGAAGGPTIINQVVLAIINYVDLQMPLEKAVGATRFHHQWSPNELVVERTFPAAWRTGLVQLGHKLRERDAIGVTQAITWSTDDQVFIGVHDPRVPGLAAGP